VLVLGALRRRRDRLRRDALRLARSAPTSRCAGSVQLHRPIAQGGPRLAAGFSRNGDVSGDRAAIHATDISYSGAW